MERSSPNWIAAVALALVASGCTDEGVGDPCIPETIPCNAEGTVCGVRKSESYIEATSVQCRSRLCIVHKLDNSSEKIPADPRKTCDKFDDPDDPDAEGCLDPKELLKSVYCTCRCDGPKTSLEFCDCPDDFTCEPILNLGGPGIQGSYCVRKGSN